MSVSFYCSPQQTLKSNPTDQDLQLRGGAFLNGTFNRTGDKQSYKSASAVCKASLNRNGETNEWQGPSHVFVQIDGKWIQFRQSGLWR
jgi:hypothetical protein